MRHDLDRPPYLSHQALKISLLLLNRKGYCLIVNEGQGIWTDKSQICADCIWDKPKSSYLFSESQLFRRYCFKEREDRNRSTDEETHYLSEGTQTLWRGDALLLYGGIQWHAVFFPSIQYTDALCNFKTCTLLWMYYKIPTFFLLLALLCDLHCFIPKWLIVLIWGNVLSWEKPRRKWRGGEAFFLEGIQLSCLWAQGYWKADSNKGILLHFDSITLSHPTFYVSLLKQSYPNLSNSLKALSAQVLISCWLKRCTMWELQVLFGAKWGLQPRKQPQRALRDCSKEAMREGQYIRFWWNGTSVQSDTYFTRFSARSWCHHEGIQCFSRYEEMQGFGIMKSIPKNI